MSSTSFPGMEHQRFSRFPPPTTPAPKPAPPAPTAEQRLQALRIAAEQRFGTDEATLRVAVKYAEYLATGNVGRQP